MDICYSTRTIPTTNDNKIQLPNLHIVLSYINVYIPFDEQLTPCKLQTRRKRLQEGAAGGGVEKIAVSLQASQ